MPRCAVRNADRSPSDRTQRADTRRVALIISVSAVGMRQTEKGSPNPTKLWLSRAERIFLAAVRPLHANVSSPIYSIEPPRRCSFKHRHDTRHTTSHSPPHARCPDHNVSSYDYSLTATPRTPFSSSPRIRRNGQVHSSHDA
jgi:hypothetical protein